jgi:hypothetical protein
MARYTPDRLKPEKGWHARACAEAGLVGRGPSQPQKAFDPFFLRGPVTGNLCVPEVYLSKGSHDALVDDRVSRGKSAPTDQCLMALWHLGGAVARPATEDTAFGKRTAAYLLSYDSCWIDQKQGDAVVQWTRDQIEAAKPHSPGGSYHNFPGVGADLDAVREAYGPN